MNGRENRLLGRWGEALTADYLRKQGYEVVASGWRCRFGEIDLIAQNREYLCFVEVKLRRNDAHGTAGSFVDFRKQGRLHTSAELYLAEHGTDRQPRFDVVEIYAPQGLKTTSPDLIWHQNAFY